MYELLERKTPSGKRKIVPSIPHRAWKYKEVIRPCGQCVGCRVKRRMDLALRLQHEAEYHDHSWFITLTYAPEHLPHGGSLVHDHISKFIRALRKKMPKQKIRFFGVGEYGKANEQNEYLARPHYHLIIFGPDIPDRKKLYAKPLGYVPSAQQVQLLGPAHGVTHFESELLSSVWKKGFVEFTFTSEATMQYVSKYHIDKVTGDKAEEHYLAVADNGELIQREREKARMSLKPGLGHQWIEDYWQLVYPHGYIMDRKVKFAPPKYYDKWLEKNHPEMYEEMKAEREKVINYDILIDTRRHAIEKNQEAQLATRKRITPTGRGPCADANQLTDQAKNL